MTKRNEALAEAHRGKPCIAKYTTGLYQCGLPSNGDHIINFAGNPEMDFEGNMWDLCLKHHAEKGAIGLRAFAKKEGLETELIKRGLVFNELKNNWFWPREVLDQVWNLKKESK